MGPSATEGANIVIVDTSFLVALQNRDDHFHEPARQVPLHGDRFLVPWEVWVEYADVLMRALPPDLVEQALASTLEGPFEIRHVLEPQDFPKLAGRSGKIQARMAGSRRKPMSFFDLVVCLVAERYRDAILTYDQGIMAAIRGQLFPGARLA